MSTQEAKPVPPRLVSVDAYRGFVMFLMMAEVLHLAVLATLHPGGPWALLAHHQEHVAWIGCTLHDLIQPSFSFLVGVALPFSIAARLARGQTKGRLLLHAFWRSLVLIALGIFLRSVGKPQTNFTFEDTLTQIGLGYSFLFLLGIRPEREQWIAFVLILVGYWAAFALYNAPADLDYGAVGVEPNWEHLKGFAAHWDKNSNPAWAFDVWFLNLFPRASPFAFNRGGYATLSFIPTLATMVLGLLAGNLLQSPRKEVAKISALLVAGVLGLAAGWGFGELGICPVVKRIWTPSWVLFSGGWCCLLLAGWHVTVDLVRAPFNKWPFPFLVIGMNSIAAYVLSHLLEDFIVESTKTHLGQDIFGAFGAAYAPVVQGATVLLILWVVLLWMYQRRVFLRV